ncbi:MAG: division plane positioning ATPase MipZ [Caulobacterales bacterium]|jgi:chromosome partitioning protein
MTSAMVGEAMTLEPMEIREPHVLVIGNEKGGAGKSTVAMHLIVALLRMGKRVGALDLDLRQRTLARYLENRAAWSAQSRLALPQPLSLPLSPSRARDLDTVEAEDAESFAAVLAQNGHLDFIVIDAPGSDTFLSRLAHSYADTLISPLNDSFIDFDLLGDIDGASFEVLKPSIYAELVWECRKRKAQRARRPIDWVVMPNRLAAGKIESKNRQRMAEALRVLSARIGFRIAPGLTERVVFRELFPKGLTLMDLDKGGGGLSMSHIAARQEVRDLMIVLKLPGMDGAPLQF